MTGTMLIALAALLNSAALVCLRWAERDIHWNQVTLSISLPSLGFLGLGVLAYGLAFVLTIRIMGQNDLAYTVPVFVGLQFVFSMLAARFAFQEQLSWTHGAGAMCILLGVVLIGWRR
jgi:drug/metabolite transporter (DMT)-like permease